MTPTVYISRTGILEPLGQGQVLAYLRGLSSEFAVTLISFERDADLVDAAQLDEIETICAAHGIRWVRLRYRRRPRLLASGWNLIALILHTWRQARRSKARLIHTRSYIPAAAGWVVSRLTGIPYVFDMRSLWPEELITSRRLRRGSLLHRMIFRAEGRLIADAATVVSLTQAGVRYLDEAHPGCLSEDRLRVIPTCTDINRFSLPAEETRTDPPLIGCHGSLTTGWFRAELLAAMFDRLAARLPDARFEVITREDPTEVRAALGSTPETATRSGDWRTHLTIGPAKATEIHERLQRQNLSLFFYASDALSELGRSPTRMGEALGCGVPVVTNEGVGDVAEILREGRVGVVLEGNDEEALDRATAAAVELLRDPDVPRRCRAVAERIYALDAGIRDYRDIYHNIIAAQKTAP